MSTANALRGLYAETEEFRRELYALERTVRENNDRAYWRDTVLVVLIAVVGVMVGVVMVVGRMP